MGQDVSNAALQGGIIQDRFGRVAVLPEGATPTDQPADLLRDVRPEVLHELWKRSVCSPHQQVKVIRGKDEPEDLDVVEARRASERPADDRIRPWRRTHEEPSLEASRRDELNLVRDKHP